MWLMAMSAIPLLVIAVDVLYKRRITNWLRDIVFRPEDTQIYESRDVIYAWGILLFALVLVSWGLKELFWPTNVIEGRDDGLAVRLRGPFRKASVIAWPNVVDISAQTMSDEGDTLPLLRIEVLGRQGLPDHPWGARWVEERTLGVLAQDWSDPPDVVATSLTEFAVAAVRREAKRRTTRLWEPES